MIIRSCALSYTIMFSMRAIGPWDGLCCQSMLNCAKAEVLNNSNSAPTPARRVRLEGERCRELFETHAYEIQLWNQETSSRRLGSRANLQHSHNEQRANLTGATDVPGLGNGNGEPGLSALGCITGASWGRSGTRKGLRAALCLANLKTPRSKKPIGALKLAMPGVVTVTVLDVLGGLRNVEPRTRLPSVPPPLVASTSFGFANIVATKAAAAAIRPRLLKVERCLPSSSKLAGVSVSNGHCH